MRALWSERPNCSHNVSQKVKRIRRLSEKGVLAPFLEPQALHAPGEELTSSDGNTNGMFRRFPMEPFLETL